MKTPKSRWLIILLLVVYYPICIVFDFFYEDYLVTVIKDPSAIKLALGTNYAVITLGAVAALPFYLLILLFPILTYSGGHNFFIVDKKRKGWTLLWTIVTFLFFFLPLAWGFFAILDSYMPGFIFVALTLFLFLTLRASLVAYSPNK